MKKILTALIAAMLMTTAAHALDKSGQISKKYSYDNLQMKAGRNGRCAIAGTIINNSGKIGTNVYITFMAYDNFDQLLWTHIVWVKAIDKNGGKHSFSESVSQCQHDNPYKFNFQVTELEE